LSAEGVFNAIVRMMARHALDNRIGPSTVCVGCSAVSRRKP
jgi:hypothetical protein